MSRNELWNGSNLHSVDCQLVAGTGFLAVACPGFYLGISKIVNLELVTATGVGAGTAVITNIVAANAGAVGAHGVSITVASSVATDASLYRIWWVNEYASTPATAPSLSP